MRRVFDVGSVRVARSLAGRMMGLIGRHWTATPLLFPRCSSIHTFFMRISVDIVCLDAEDRIVSIYDTVRPWRLVFGAKGTRSVFELPAGYARHHDLTVGETLIWEESEHV